MTYKEEGKIILTTKIKLKLHGKILKLLAIEEDLNNGSGFSVSVLFTGTLTLHNTSQISILLGGDNNLFFPTEVECNPLGMVFYQSNLTQNHLVYSPVPSNAITWMDQLTSIFINTLFVKSIVIQENQEKKEQKIPGESGVSGVSGAGESEKLEESGVGESAKSGE